MNLNVWIIIFLFVSFRIVHDRNLIWLGVKFNLSVTDGTRQSVAYAFDHHKFDFTLASAWLEKNAKLSIPYKPQKIERPLILRFKSHTPFVNASIDYLHNLTKKCDKLSFNVSIMVNMRHLLQNKQQYGNFLNLTTFTFPDNGRIYATLCVYDKTWYVRFEKYQNTLNYILNRVK